MGLTISYLQRVAGMKGATDDKNLKGISRYINTITNRGRANVSILSLSFYVIAVYYFFSINRKKEEKSRRQ